MALLLGALFAVPAFAITESEVEAQAAASGKEAIVGNVLIWFLCAVGFLKVSQKIDSFMQGIGLNVGHTGGSLLAEALIATRGIKMVTGGGGHTSGGNHSGAAGGNGIGSYFKGGLVGMASRRAANNAVKTATSNTTVNSPAFSSSSTSAHSSHKASNTAKSTQNTAQSVRHDGQGPIAAQSSSLGEMPRLSDQTGQAPVFAADSADVTATPATVDLTVPHEPAPINAPSREPAQTDILRTDTERTDFEPRDISELSGDLLTVGMFVALDYVWDKAKENRTEEKAIFIDECWQLIGANSNRLAAEFVLEIFKIIRGYGGSAICATQDMNDFLSLEDGKYGKGIINVCKTKILLNLEDEEARRVQSILHLSDTEVMEITHFERGNGLISTNNNNVTVEIKCSQMEKEMITTDRRELQELLDRAAEERAAL